METGAYLQKLIESNYLREPVIRSVIRALELPAGSRGLDVGCGYGAQVLWLAEAVGPAGHVTGLDLRREFLACAGGLAERAGLSDRTAFREGDMYNLPFDDDSFDWAWSMDCVGYHPGDPLPPLKELVRVVKPGGIVAIAAWSSERLLPGYPRLEARLGATASGIAPFAQGDDPESHFLRALGWFHKLGLVEPTARTIAGQAGAPLSDDLRRALIGLFQMRWEGVQSELSQEDWAAYQQLCCPESTDFVLDAPGYYAFFTYSVFWGKVPNCQRSELIR
ncbi:MAG: class I SAM-dependent methyltransferase [Anaerolineae bacterium]|nr:class I SAM-dependent methyltransferase [Anaerolineae bacterium]